MELPRANAKADVTERNSWMDQEDGIEEVGHLQDEIDDSAYGNFELYGVFHTKIVGIRYYSGRATIGEFVVVRREPFNPYDSNAIRINNVMGDQIGHLGRHCAAKLAP